MRLAAAVIMSTVSRGHHGSLEAVARRGVVCSVDGGSRGGSTLRRMVVGVA